MLKNNLPMGHGLSLQAWLSVSNPVQFAPPYLGAGFVQVLVWDWDPPPQVKEQVDQADQADHPPSKKINQTLITDTGS